MLSMQNYRETHVGGSNLVTNVFDIVTVTYKSDCEVYFSYAFTMETRLFTSQVFFIIYFQILCFITDMVQKTIPWMTIISVTESTLW